MLMTRVGNPKDSDMGNVHSLGDSDLQEPLLDYHDSSSCGGRVPKAISWKRPSRGGIGAPGRQLEKETGSPLPPSQVLGFETNTSVSFDRKAEEGLDGNGKSTKQRRVMSSAWGFRLTKRSPEHGHRSLLRGREAGDGLLAGHVHCSYLEVSGMRCTHPPGSCVPTPLPHTHSSLPFTGEGARVIVFQSCILTTP